MQRPILYGIHPMTKLIFVVFLVLVSVILSLLIAFGLGVLFFSSEDLMGAFAGSLSNIAVLKYLQIIQTIGIFISPAILAGWFFSADTLEFLRMRNPKNVTLFSLSIVFLLTIAFFPVIDFTGYLNQQMHLPGFLGGLESWMRQMEDVAKVLTEKFTTVNTLGGLAINILMIGILPAMGEEMLFRGTVQPLFNSWFKNNHAAIWVTAILFSAMHMQFYGFIPRMILGAYMGYLLVWSGSLWLPMFAHFVNNTIGVILYYMFYNGSIEQNPESLGYETSLIPVVLSIIIIGLLMYFLKTR